MCRQQVGAGCPACIPAHRAADLTHQDWAFQVTVMDSHPLHLALKMTAAGTTTDVLI